MKHERWHFDLIRAEQGAARQVVGPHDGGNFEMGAGFGDAGGGAQFEGEGMGGDVFVDGGGGGRLGFEEREGVGVGRGL